MTRMPTVISLGLLLAGTLGLASPAARAHAGRPHGGPASDPGNESPLVRTAHVVVPATRKTGIEGWEWFAAALSADGHTAAVGSKAVVVVLSDAAGTGWRVTLRIPGPVGTSSFTESLGLSADGNTLAVGVPALTTVWIYTRSGGVWRRTAQVRPPGGHGDFGGAVALSGDGRTLFVGAARRSPLRTIWAGVDVYGRTPSGWSPTAVIDAPKRPLGGESFGQTLAASATGDTAVVAAPDDAKWDRDLFTHGAVHVYGRSAGRWRSLDTLRIPDRVAKSGFGHALAVSADGTTVAVGGPRLYTFQDAARGAAPVGAHRYRLTGRFGTFQAPGVDTVFGSSLALSGDGRTVVAGDELRTLHGVVAAGRVHRYVRSGTAWRFGGVLDPAPCARPCDRSRYGTAVAVDATGRRVLVVERADARPWSTGVDVYERR